MAGTRGRSGGKRNGSGRRPKNRTWGPRDTAQGLERHFRPVNSQPPVSRTTQNSSTTTNETSNEGVEDNHTAQVELPPLPPSPPRPARPPPRRQEIAENLLPDNDLDNDVLQLGDNVATKGKRISGSTNLRLQHEAIMSPGYFKKAVEKIKSFGMCWDHSPTIVKDMALNLVTCWMAFFQLRVFNWIPEYIIGGNWKPKCPNCHNPLAKNGRTNPPRLVFDQNNNYWLNAPQRYICTTCDRENKRNPSAEQKHVSYTSTSDEILKQIKLSEPEVMEMFPCYLTTHNAVDKHLMDLIIHSAVKGIGPSALSEMLCSWHELWWQKQENQWGRYLLRRLNQPTIMDNGIRRSDIEKCPGYFSLKMGGCIPSGKYLVDLFCKVVQEERPYLDSEVIKRLRTTLYLAIDASYKVPKWMMTQGEGQRLYDALLSATNEYNEVPMQLFATSDNHDELGANFARLAALGLDPILAFSDDPGRDESLLKKHFPRLRQLRDELEDEDNDERPEDMPEFTTPKRISYIYEIDRAVLALNQFIKDLEDAISNPSGSQVKVSFDAEWPIFKSPQGENQTTTHGDINILQLASNVVDYTILLELYSFADNPQQLKRIGQKLKAVFSLNVSCFVGCKQSSDYTLLRKQYPVFDLPDSATQKMADVSKMALNRGVAKPGKEKTTLKALCKGQDLYLQKPRSIRVGTIFDSRNGTLPLEAQKYCQNDAEAPLILHQIYLGMTDLSKRINRYEPLDVGVVVDIMPEKGSDIEPIAQGRVKQQGGSTWQTNGVKLRKDQVLVEVTQVFKTKGIIHYPSTTRNTKACACNRAAHGKIDEKCTFYLYSQYGPPPFLTVELKSRLRLFNENTDYPACVYSADNQPSQVPAQLTNFSNQQDDEERQDTDEESVFGDGDDEDTVRSNTGDDDDDTQYDTIPRIPANLIADDDKDNSDDEDEHQLEGNPTRREINTATAASFDDVLNKIIEDADELADRSKDDTEAQDTEEEYLQLFRTVLGDMFHFMDRAKLPMHHEFKALFFRALRAASFIMVKEDVDNVKAVLQRKPGESWEKKMAFDWQYIARRARRRVPPPHILYHRMKAVYDFFKDKVDSKTNVVLFNDRNRNKFENMLEMVKKGYASDPPNVSLYTAKTDSYGRIMVDKDGLVLYRSLRGTSNLESMHQYLTTSFGHTVASPYYSDCLLTILRHMLNWRMSRKNRPGFPKLSHYNGLLIDRINSLYELIFGHAKYSEWSSFNENLPTSMAFGIIAVNERFTQSVSATEADKELVSQNQTLKYIAERQGTPVPFLPIKGKNEKQLIHKILSEIITSDTSLTSQTLFDKIALRWNTHEVDVSKKIYAKLPCHFARYIKKWSKNQDRRDAAIASGSDQLNNALEYVPGLQPEQNFEAAPVEPVENSNLDRSNDPTEDLPTISSPPTETSILEPPPQAPGVLLLCNVCENSTEVQPTRPPARPPVRPPVRKRRCRMVVNGVGCPDPYICRGKNNRKNCMMIVRGDVTKLSKRKIQKKTKPRCSICNLNDCIGIRMRARCWMYNDRNDL